MDGQEPVTTRRLLKAEVLNGAKTPHEIHFDELEGTLVLYPLTEGQWAEVEARNMQGIDVDVDTEDVDVTDKEQLRKLKPKIRFDLLRLTRAQFEANVLAVACSLSGGEEKWTEDEVRAMRAGVLEAVADKVYEISGVEGDVMKRVQEKGVGGLEAEVAAFHEDERGDSDCEDAGAGDAAGGESA
jgi:hypothetical protein